MFRVTVSYSSLENANTYWLKSFPYLLMSETPRSLQPKNASGSFSLKWKRSVKQALRPKETCFKKRTTSKLDLRSVKIDYYGA